jgi:hypothetical protein
MVKWVKLTQNQYFGFYALGLAFFALQELPYIVMPLIPLQTNPLMEMADKSAVLNVLEKISGISCIIALLFLVRGDARLFSLKSAKEVVFFVVAMLAIVGYFVGWAFYFNGYQSIPLMLCTLVALPPVYYAFIGLWRGNPLLAALGGLFLVAHLSNVGYNL